MKASILWTLLPVVATTTNALHVPIKPRDDQFRLTTPSPDADTSSHKIATTTTPFDERPLASAEDILFADTTESTGDWPCHLHGWVRAPDLQPDTVIPAEARLVVNGTKCDMITKWQVGLRFKERAVIKRKADGAELPSRPEPFFNATNWAWASGGDQDRWGMFSKGGGGFEMNAEMEKFNAQRAQYTKDVNDPSLWDVHGVERDVFDTTIELSPPVPDAESWLDTVRPFVIHMPNTNFPAIEVQHHMFSVNDGALTTLETLLEYYFIVTLSNHVVIELPVAQTAFLPRPVEVPAEVDLWPKTVRPESPRIKYPEDDFRSTTPSCDNGSLAEFQVSFDKVSTGPIMQGTNITLNVTVTRTGNGSEYPAKLEVFHLTNHTYTWARDQVKSEEEFNSVARNHRAYEHYNGVQFTEMLMADDYATLHARRQLQADRNAGVFTVHSQHSTYVYDFDLTSETARDSYNFEMEVHIPFNEMPTSKSTFESIIPTLGFSLNTQFLCVPPPKKNSQWPVWVPKMAIPEETTSTNDDWTAYTVPSLVTKESDGSEGRRSRVGHLGNVSINVVPSLASTNPAPVHYIDPEARGPVLSLHASDIVEHAPLGAVRPELDHELRQCRWSYPCAQHAYTCLQPPCGGQGKHAAMLWMRKEALDNGEEVGEPEPERFGRPGMRMAAPRVSYHQKPL